MKVCGGAATTDAVGPPSDDVSAAVSADTTTMPTNFLIEKGGRIKSIAAGCDPSGLLASKLSEKVADLLDTETADVKRTAQKTQESKK